MTRTRKKKEVMLDNTVYEEVYMFSKIFGWSFNDTLNKLLRASLKNMRSNEIKEDVLQQLFARK